MSAITQLLQENPLLTLILGAILSFVFADLWTAIKNRIQFLRSSRSKSQATEQIRKWQEEIKEFETYRGNSQAIYLASRLKLSELIRRFIRYLIGVGLLGVLGVIYSLLSLRPSIIYGALFLEIAFLAMAIASALADYQDIVFFELSANNPDFTISKLQRQIEELQDKFDISTSEEGG